MPRVRIQSGVTSLIVSPSFPTTFTFSAANANPLYVWAA